MKKELKVEELNKKVFKNLESIDSLNILERYAYFLGKAQIIEFGLKKFLTERYNYQAEKLEKNTLGQLIYKMKEEGIRPDFTRLLEELLAYRNSMVHEFLNNFVLIESIHPSSGRLVLKELNHALFKVEEITLVYDFLYVNKYI